MKKHTKNIIAFFICAFSIFNFASKTIFASSVIYQNENTKSKKSIEEESKSNDRVSTVYEIDPGVKITYDEISGKKIVDIEYPVDYDAYVENDSVEEAVKPELTDRDFVRMTSKNTILSLDEYYKSFINETPEYLYIRHTSSITNVPDNHEWNEEIDIKTKEQKKVLTYWDYGEIRKAQSGFYKIMNSTYYFDEDGYMYVGKIMDERGNVYEFDENGIMKN